MCNRYEGKGVENMSGAAARTKFLMENRVTKV